jgi:hypothetical protein
MSDDENFDDYLLGQAFSALYMLSRGDFLHDKGTDSEDLSVAKSCARKVFDLMRRSPKMAKCLSIMEQLDGKKLQYPVR